MGGSSTQTVGYWYHPTFMLGLCQGPIDAVMRFRGADVDAWEGELTASGTITINKPDLWGGIDAEGGIQGDVEFCFGEATQMPSAYYDTVFDADPSAHRGAARLIFKGEGGYATAGEYFQVNYRLGRFGAMNPYPKPVSVLARRILKGWDNDECWYPETAPIGVDGTPQGAPVEWLMVGTAGASQMLKTSPDGADWSASFAGVPLSGGGEWTPSSPTMQVHNGQVLGVASSAGSWGGSAFAFRDVDGVWYDVTARVLAAGSLPASSGRQAHSGTHWFIFCFAGGQVRCSPDPLTADFVSIGYNMQDGCRIGSRIQMAYATGASFDLVEQRHVAADGTGAVNPGNLNTGYQARHATMASDGATAMLVLHEQTVGNVWRPHVHSSTDLGVSWTDHGAPWPEYSGEDWEETRGTLALHNATANAGGSLWVVAAQRRIAMGASPGSLVVDPIEFPEAVRSIACDGVNLLVCGDGGMLYAWTAAGGWEALASGTTSLLQAVAPVDDVAPPVPGTLLAMNPAHVIYDSLVAESMQGEPIGQINDASFRGAADTLYGELFGVCTEFDPDRETCDAFRQRICNVIGAQCSRSTVDGQWYLDLIRGNYDLESLPVLTDDDILEFQCDPSTLDDAVNQVSVRWFDPLAKQERTTAPVHALGAIHAMGGIVPEVLDYPEIPFEPLADRCAARDLLARATPTKRFSLTTNRKPYAWRRGTYFRLQVPKRGIADTVCLVGEISKGTLRSGAIKLIAVQDVFSMPATSYVVGQPPASGGPAVPVPVVDQLAFEAPYTELAGSMSAADLAALDDDAGFVQVVGVRPSVGTNYQLRTRMTGTDYQSAGTFDWCPSALIEDAVDDLQATDFMLSAGTDLAAVQVGSGALWGSELVRVDALDIDTGAVSFGRACADTVPVPHVAGERVYFFDTWASSDQVEYVTGESVQAKLLTRTGTSMLDEASASELSVELDQRAARPYPPARIRINGEASLAIVAAGAVTVSWAWRDRVLQADQLVDNEAASIGPEAGTTATVRWYLDGVLVQTDAGIATTSQAYTPAGEGLLRIELEAVRDGLTSWQMQVREIYYAADALTTEDGTELIALESGEPIILE